jgi:hypothetical protein
MMQEKWVRDFYKTHVISGLEEDFLLLDREFSGELATIAVGLNKAFGQVCRQARQQQEAGLKGAAAFLCISFLRTRVLADLPVYRLDLYDDNFYRDPTECAVSWEMEFVWGIYQKRLEQIAAAAQSGFYRNKIKKNHLAEFKMALAEPFHILSVTLTRLVVEQAIRTPEYDSLLKVPYFTVRMGDYQDHNVVLYGQPLTE